MGDHSTVDVNPATVSGCAGANPGTNIVRLQWSETFKTITTTDVADYRFVVNGAVGQIVRLAQRQVRGRAHPRC